MIFLQNRRVRREQIRSYFRCYHTGRDSEDEEIYGGLLTLLIIHRSFDKGLSFLENTVIVCAA